MEERNWLADMYWLYIYIRRPVGFEGHAFPAAQFSTAYGGILWTKG